MNCKPGDLARVVGSLHGNNDKLVRVIEPCLLNGQPIGTRTVVGEAFFQVKQPGLFAWVVEALGAPLQKESGRTYRVCPVADNHLRPIRDPGEDARDETLEWRTVPNKPTEAA